MKDLGIVRGSEAQAKDLIIGTDTVYVHTDIEQVKTEDDQIEYQYHEFQYEKNEYIEIMAKKNKELDELMNTILGVN